MVRKTGLGHKHKADDGQMAYITALMTENTLKGNRWLQQVEDEKDALVADGESADDDRLAG